jgi:hypothetical protein
MPGHGVFIPRQPLPVVTSERPNFHPECCLSLSTTTPNQIINVLPSKDALILSIGAGSGLLEALMSFAEPSLRIEVVEVSSVNKYMPDEMLHTAKGTWEIISRAKDCDVLMFVYPRHPSLVKKYIDSLDLSANVQSIVWIGPTYDWEDFKKSFERSSFTPSNSPIQISPWELLTINFRTYSCQHPTDDLEDATNVS